MMAPAQIPETPWLGDLAQAARGRLHGPDRTFDGVTIDTRRLRPGAVFFALQGANSNGHDHVAGAAAAGAAGAVVERRLDAPLSQIEVTDTQVALQQAGAAWRQGYQGPVVGITGSNGKTTVRRMVTAILTHHATPVLASRENFNNHLGVPLTLLELHHDHTAAVVELGANHAGEIENLAQLAQPTIGLITNAGDAHLEGFGSLDGVARAKGELYEQLAPGSTAIINADDDYAEQWARTAHHCRQLYFSLDGVQADVRAHDVALHGAASHFMLQLPDAQQRIELALPGAHNVRNALAAATVAAAMAIPAADIAAGLAAVTPEAGRLAASAGPHGARIVDDSYNANPVSLHVALDWLARQTGPRWLVLGDMAELGAGADAAHREAGRRARTLGVERLWALGDKSRLAGDSFGDGAAWFADNDQLAQALAAALSHNRAQPPVVLVKGSRSARMDRVVASLKAGVAGGAPC